MTGWFIMGFVSLGMSIWMILTDDREWGYRYQQLGLTFFVLGYLSDIAHNRRKP